MTRFYYAPNEFHQMQMIAEVNVNPLTFMLWLCQTSLAGKIY